MIKELAVEHRVHVTERSFDNVVTAFMAATGSVEEGYEKVAASAATEEEFEAVFRAREGSSGFMRFMVVDHGKWLATVGQPAKALMIVLGNPLLARTMLRHDIGAGLDVPVRIFIHEDGDGRTRVSYDLPSSLMSFSDNPELGAPAARLDAKLVSLAEAISGVSA